MKKHVLFVMFAAALMSLSGSVVAADDEFDIVRFQVDGNTLLPSSEVEGLVAPFSGVHKRYGDVQKALEALENAYRAKGYGAVQVYVPEQELTSGVVHLTVTEAVIGKISIKGNRYFSNENVLNSLPLLKVGSAPNLGRISENVELAKENPSKQEEVTFSVSEEEGKVNANVQVDDDSPKKFIFTLDNMGMKDLTGQYRLGAAYRDANLAGKDEVFTLGYITAPDAPGGVNVESFGIGFRKPFYSLGDSLDVIWASSSVNVPANVIAPGGALSMNGKGEVLALRWNHLFPRQGEYSSKLIFGFDQRDLHNPCKAGGFSLVTGGCVSLYETVMSATYSGQLQQVGVIADYSLGFFQNMGWGIEQQSWRYVYAAGNRAAKREFNYVQAGGNVSYLLSWGGMFHAGLASQYSADPLPAFDQFSLTGYSAVRGFNERAVTADSGYVLNLELYSQDLAPWLNVPVGILKALTFFDMASGYNKLTPNSTYVNDTGVLTTASGRPNERIHLSSVGVGLRYALGKDVTARFDVARILQSTPASPFLPGYIDTDWRAHFGLTYTY